MGRKADFKNKVNKPKSSKRKPDFEKFITDENSSQTRGDKTLKAKKRKLSQDRQNKDFGNIKVVKSTDTFNDKQQVWEPSSDEEEIPELVDPETIEKNDASKEKGMPARKKIKLFDNENMEEESDDEEDPEQKRIRGLNKMIEELNKEESSEEEEEIQTQEPEEDDEDQIELFPEEDDNGIKTVPDFKLAFMRINAIIAALANFKKFKKEGKSRADYIERLTKDLCTYFSYNEYLIEKLLDIFSPPQVLEFLEANEIQRPETIRVNSLKTNRRNLAQTLSQRGFKLDKLDYSPVGLVVYNSAKELGSTTEYLAGHYIKQGGGSWFPVMALAPQENEVILDMCAAPGGKATHIGQIMRNTGVLVANDYREDRVKAVIGNLHRMGIANAVVSVRDGRDFPEAFSIKFDRVLLDAPCSGTGVISKDHKVKKSKNYEEIKNLAHLQKQLILSAIDSLKVKGTLVYSTCSILVEENEDVIQYAMNKRKVKIVPTGLTVGIEGFTRLVKKRYHPTMTNTKRFYPHVHNVEGFFVAKLVKLEEHQPKPLDDEETPTKPKKSKKLNESNDEEECELLSFCEEMDQKDSIEDEEEPSPELKKKTPPNPKKDSPKKTKKLDRSLTEESTISNDQSLENSEVRKKKALQNSKAKPATQEKSDPKTKPLIKKKKNKAIQNGTTKPIKKKQKVISKA